MEYGKVELRRVYKTFRTNGRIIEAIRDVSFEVQPREFVTIIGPSGSGKSTIFNLIVGLLEPDSGEICLEGQVCTERTGMTGYMPQRDLLMPWRTVLENVNIAQEVRRVPKEQANKRSYELLPLFGLEGFAHAYPNSLSGGMRQRAALLRTVLTDSDILLLDEPFGALDALTRKKMQDWFLDLWRRLRPTVLFITHDVTEALYLADRVLVLSARPGKIQSTLEVDLPRPRHQGLITSSGFVEQEAQLLRMLGIQVEAKSNL
jgi:ABC-type nitrate/sulfonate/bicarbonate transport system ATPase subunit